MSDKTAFRVDVAFDPLNTVEAELRTLAVALRVLHQQAHEAWPGRYYTQSVEASNGVFTVELHVMPDEVQALFKAA